MSLSLGSLELAGDVVDELKSKLLDVIIVGGGPAGLNAALYAARYKLSVAVISEDIGGQVGKAGWVENYLGYERIMGPDLVSKFEQHVKSYGVPFLLDSVASVRRGW
jgi:thioredoxin reductase (NADPH) (EC 1.8.1.9)